MSVDEPGHVRLRIEMLLEIAGPEELTRAALARIAGDEAMPDAEREPATEAVTQDPAEAVAYLVDPIDLVSDLPGVELAQASWASEQADADLEADWFGDEETGPDLAGQTDEGPAGPGGHAPRMDTWEEEGGHL